MGDTPIDANALVEPYLGAIVIALAIAAVVLLVGVVVRRRLVEVAQDRTRSRAGIVVATMLRQVALQALECRELLFDASVAGAQHAERVVEGRRCGFAKEIGAHDGGQKSANGPAADRVSATETT